MVDSRAYNLKFHNQRFSIKHRYRVNVSSAKGAAKLAGSICSLVKDRDIVLSCIGKMCVADAIMAVNTANAFLEKDGAEYRLLIIPFVQYDPAFIKKNEEPGCSITYLFIDKIPVPTFEAEVYL